MECKLKCGQDNIPREMMEEHVTTLCPKAEHLCPFSCQGCHYRVSIIFSLCFTASIMRSRKLLSCLRWHFALVKVNKSLYLI